MARDDGALRMTASWGARDFEYVLRLESRRDLLITVHPDLRVDVAAPRSRSVDEVVRRVHARRSWIARQLRAFEEQPKVTPHRFVPGESCWYLGRQYRLRVEREGQGVALQGGQLIVRVAPGHGSAEIRAAIIGWYRRRARAVFSARAERLQRSIGLLSGLDWTLRVRHMQRRWGSCTARGTITMNPTLVQVPPSCVDYVLAHEMVHLLESTHSRRFYRLLGRAMPDWERRKARLESFPNRLWPVVAIRMGEVSH